MADQTKHGTDVAQALVEYFDGHKADFTLEDVYYGDQVRIARSPSLCIELSTVSRTINETGCNTLNDFEFNVIIYDARVSDVQAIQLDLDQRAEAIIDAINTLGRLDGLVIYIFALDAEFGYQIKQNGLMRAARIVAKAQSKTEL